MFYNRLYSVDRKSCRAIHNLPPRLRRLALCEGHCSSSWLELLARPDNVDRMCLPYLEELVVDMEPMPYVTAFFGWWDLPSLRRLTFQSSSVYKSYRSHWGCAPALLLNKRLAPWLLRISASLEQGILLNAWQMGQRFWLQLGQRFYNH